MLIRCPACGKSVSSDSLACPYCGQLEPRNGSGTGLMVDKSTRCANPKCHKQIPIKGWQFAYITELPEGDIIFCSPPCSREAGYDCTGRVRSVIRDSPPTPEEVRQEREESKKDKIKALKLILGFINILLIYFGFKAEPDSFSSRQKINIAK